jgi:hypothetical protein
MQMRVGLAQSRGRCGLGEPSPDADMEGVSPVPVQMQARASLVPVHVSGVQMWAGRVSMQMRVGLAQSRGRCGLGEPSPDADMEGVSPVPVQMWKG